MEQYKLSEKQRNSKSDWVAMRIKEVKMVEQDREEKRIAKEQAFKRDMEQSVRDAVSYNNVC